MDWMCAKIGESSDSRNYPLAWCEDVREWAREKRPKAAGKWRINLVQSMHNAYVHRSDLMALTRDISGIGLWGNTTFNQCMAAPDITCSIKVDMQCIHHAKGLYAWRDRASSSSQNAMWRTRPPKRCSTMRTLFACLSSSVSLTLPYLHLAHDFALNNRHVRLQ